MWMVRYQKTLRPVYDGCRKILVLVIHENVLETNIHNTAVCVFKFHPESFVV